MWNATLGQINVLLMIATPLLQAGVRTALRDVPQINLLQEHAASSGQGAEVVVTDSASGLHAIDFDGRPELAALRPHSRVLAVCQHAREHSVETALRSGVHGFVRASCSVDELVEAIRTLALGALYVCPDVAQRMAATFSRDALTTREAHVLQLLARGQCNKTIARDLGIALGTVKTHVKGIMMKLGASSRTEAASIAAEKGLVDIPEFRSRRAPWPAATPPAGWAPAVGHDELAVA